MDTTRTRGSVFLHWGSYCPLTALLFLLATEEKGAQGRKHEKEIGVSESYNQATAM